MKRSITHDLLHHVETSNTYDLVDPGLEKKWESSLIKTPEHPFPLAPVDLVEMGLVTPTNYRRENIQFGKFCSLIMKRELGELLTHPGYQNIRGYIIQVFGAGLLRDLREWVPDVTRSGFGVHVVDNCGYACRKAEKFFERRQIPADVTHGELFALLKAGRIDELSSIVEYACQFMQIHEEWNVRRLAFHFGRFLRHNTEENSPKRRVYVCHARGEDNSGPVEWGGQVLGPPRWNNTTPYLDDQWIPSVRKGLGGPLQVKILGQHCYFHQKYTFFRLMAGPRGGCR